MNFNAIETLTASPVGTLAFSLDGGDVDSDEDVSPDKRRFPRSVSCSGIRGHVRAAPHAALAQY